MIDTLVLALLLLGATWPLGFAFMRWAMPGWIIVTKRERPRVLFFASFLVGCVIVGGALAFALFLPLPAALALGVLISGGLVSLFMHSLEARVSEEEMPEAREEIMREHGISEPSEEELEKIDRLALGRLEEVPPMVEIEEKERLGEEAAAEALAKLAEKAGVEVEAKKVEPLAEEKKVFPIKHVKRAKRWYTTSEAVEELEGRVTPRTIQRWVSSREIKARKDRRTGKFLIPAKEIARLRKKIEIR